jgi:hypothetical protein
MLVEKTLKDALRDIGLAPATLRAASLAQLARVDEALRGLMAETIRQVAVGCFERGRAVATIWKMHRDASEGFKARFEEQMEELLRRGATERGGAPADASVGNAEDEAARERGEVGEKVAAAREGPRRELEGAHAAELQACWAKEKELKAKIQQLVDCVRAS